MDENIKYIEDGLPVWSKIIKLPEYNGIQSYNPTIRRYVI
jgi:hypothetical protein